MHTCLCSQPLTITGTLGFLLIACSLFPKLWTLFPLFTTCKDVYRSSGFYIYWDPFHITNTLTAITYTSLHKAFMAFSRAGKQAMIFTTEQSQSSIRMACQLVLNSSSTGVSSQKGGTVEILVCLGSISESCMQVSLHDTARVSYTQRTLSRWILLLLFFVCALGVFLLGIFRWILIFISCLNSNNIDSLIKCLDFGRANKRRRQWRCHGRDLDGSQWKSQGLGNDLCLTEISVLNHMGKTISKTSKAHPPVKKQESLHE